jgi:pilus assembly protein Flp/PilA
LKKTMERIKAFLSDEEGASAVEYALLVAGIAVAVAAAIWGLGDVVNTKLTNATTDIAAHP